MDIQVSNYEICEQFLAFITSIDVLPYDGNIQFITDGQLHRFRTREDDPSEKSGTYVLHNDGLPSGYVKDWRKNIEYTWHFETKNSDQKVRDYFNSDEFKKEAKKREKERKANQAKASDEASSRISLLPLLNTPNFQYIKNKHIPVYNVHFNPANNSLAVPMYDIEGNVKSLQWIDAEGQKRFYPGAPQEGLFWYFSPNEIKDGDTLLVGEGFATMCKIHQLTNMPVFAAMTCGKLLRICKALRKKYPHSKIFITADNDLATYEKIGRNPGLEAANNAVAKKAADAVILPDFPFHNIGSDWDDYAIRYGDQSTTDTIMGQIRWWLLSDDERKEIETRRNLKRYENFLDPSIQLPPQEFIGGIFPRKFITIIAAAPGTGKTMFMQKLASDLSLGGSIFNGVAKNEPIRTILIFAGEAGWELLVRRAATMKWEVDPYKVIVIDQYQYESKGISLMLNEEEGWKNVVRFVDMHKPDIVFWDTFSSFHEGDENKATEIKPLIRKIATLAHDYDFAAVLNHHSRKRMAKERNISLSQDDVIGSSIFNRLAALIIGIEHDQEVSEMLENEGKVLKVRHMKTWFTPFKPFNFTIEKDFYGHTVMNTDLNPKENQTSSNAVWNYLVSTFAPGEWFSRENIVIDLITPIISDRQLRRILTDLADSNKLEKQGENRWTKYAIPQTQK